MYKNELYKIFTQKSIYVIFTIIILIMIYASGYPETMKEDIYLHLAEEWEGPITEEKLALATEKMRESDEQAAQNEQYNSEGDHDVYFPEPPIETYATGTVHFRVAVAGQYLDSLRERKNTLKGDINKLKRTSYDSKKAKKELTMLEKLDNPYGFYLIRAWNGMIDLIEPTMTVIFLSALILVGLTPVFSDEYRSRTIGLILATKHGKRKIVTAKMMAALTYIGIIFISLHIFNLFLQWKTYGGFHGGQAPMQNLLGAVIDYPFNEASPFPWTVWQFYVIKLTVQFLGCMALAVLVLCISTVIRNNLLTFFISGAIIGVPLMVRQLGLEHGLFKYITAFNYVEFLSVEHLFKDFKVYNIVDQPVLYSTVFLMIFISLTIGLILFTYYRFSRQEVTK